MIIAVDFDGTLHCGEYPEVGVPAPYAIEKMRKLKGAWPLYYYQHMQM